MNIALEQFTISPSVHSVHPLVSDMSCSVITSMKTKHEAHVTVESAADVDNEEEKHWLT